MQIDNNQQNHEVMKEGPERAESPSIVGLKVKDLVEGTVSRLEIYGAFIDIGLEVPAILHVSKIGKRVNRVSDVFNIGDKVSVWVDSVDPEKEQITVSMIEPYAVDWSDLKVGQDYSGKVTRLEKFGAFVDIGAEKEGLIHISELSNDYVKHPSEVLSVDEEVEVKVIGFSKKKRRIDLSRKQLLESPQSEVPEVEELELEDDEPENMPTAMEIALRRAMEDPAVKGSLQSKGKSSSGRKGKSLRKQQDDILDRTLKMGREGNS